MERSSIPLSEVQEGWRIRGPRDIAMAAGTLRSGPLVAGAYGFSVIVATAGGVVAVVTNGLRVLWAGTLAAGFLALAAPIVSAALAGVRYKLI